MKDAGSHPCRCSKGCITTYYHGSDHAISTTSLRSNKLLPSTLRQSAKHSDRARKLITSNSVQLPLSISSFWWYLPVHTLFLFNQLVPYPHLGPLYISTYWNAICTRIALTRTFTFSNCFKKLPYIFEMDMYLPMYTLSIVHPVICRFQLAHVNWQPVCKQDVIDADDLRWWKLPDPHVRQF